MGSQGVQPWQLLGRGASRLPGRAASNGDQRAVLRPKKSKIDEPVIDISLVHCFMTGCMKGV